MSAVFPPTYDRVLRDHLRRIRALEANASGAPDAWATITSFTNGYSDAARSGEPPVGWMQKGALGFLRGRLKPGVLGLPAFTLPSTAPPYLEDFVTDRWPYGNARVSVAPGSGAVTVERPGYLRVIDIANGRGSMGNAIIGTGDSEGNLFDQIYQNWIQAGLGPIWDTGAAFGFDPGFGGSVATVQPTIIRVDNGPFDDSEASLVAKAAATAINLTVRGQQPFFTGIGAGFPVGYHLHLSSTPGGVLSIDAQNKDGTRPNLLTGTSPGFGAGDKIGFVAIGTRFSALVNDIEAGAVDIGSASPDLFYYPSGYCGFGFNGPTSGTALADTFVFGGPSDVNYGEVSLDGIVFSVTT